MAIRTDRPGRRRRRRRISAGGRAQRWGNRASRVPPGVAGAGKSIVPPGGYPADAVLATVGETPVSMSAPWPIRVARPYRVRRDEVVPLHTGQRAVDLLFPLARGSTAAVPGGFGTGKTVLLQQLAKWCDADVIVYVGCGERGNEMAEIVTDMLDLADPRTGGRLADRTVIIANTSNMPMMAREASIYTGVTVAEYFRDMGYHAVVIADSTSRWAEALREFASRMGELPAEEGYPASLASELAAFYERAGFVDTLGGQSGSVTVIGAVSPPGGDVSEPVTVHTERFVRCRWALDRDLAYSRLSGRLLREAVLQQNAQIPNDAYCSPDKTAALVDAVLAVIDTCREVVAAGVPAELVEEMDFGPLIRARENGGPTDTAPAATWRDEVIGRLHQLR
jgi:vacuolar-type H+-ATPase catalytic subunit A/Vma1